MLGSDVRISRNQLSHMVLLLQLFNFPWGTTPFPQTVPELTILSHHVTQFPVMTSCVAWSTTRPCLSLDVLQSTRETKVDVNQLDSSVFPILIYISHVLTLHWNPLPFLAHVLQCRSLYDISLVPLLARFLLFVCVLLPFSYFAVFLLTCCCLRRLCLPGCSLPLASRQPFEQNFETMNSIDSEV